MPVHRALDGEGASWTLFEQTCRHLSIQNLCRTLPQLKLQSVKSVWVSLCASNLLGLLLAKKLNAQMVWLEQDLVPFTPAGGSINVGFPV
jgi:hypothetical protein